MDQVGEVATFGRISAVVAFRFAVEQMGKIRARDDIKYPTENLYFSVWAPIKLPTWDHISQMARAVAGDNRQWVFSKADRGEA